MIYWRNKIAATTTNLAAGKTVNEIEVFEIKLKSGMLDESVLRQIDKEIPYHILFLLEYEGRYQAWTCYKEASFGNHAFKVNQYYHTDWMAEEELPLKLDGLNVDAVYENFVYQIAGDTLRSDAGESLKEIVEKNEERKHIEREISKLEKQARTEKQPKKKFELVQKIRKYEMKLQENEP